MEAAQLMRLVLNYSCAHGNGHSSAYNLTRNSKHMCPMNGLRSYRICGLLYLSCIMGRHHGQFYLYLCADVTFVPVFSRRTFRLCVCASWISVNILPRLFYRTLSSSLSESDPDRGLGRITAPHRNRKASRPSDLPLTFLATREMRDSSFLPDNVV